MERWYVMMKKADFSSIGAKYNISPVIARLIRNRDIIEDEEINLYLNGTIADLYDGMLMKDMDKAVEILSEKIREEKPVRVIGDYDIDGVNAAYILKEGLEGLGADVDTDIPDRIKDGYGLNKMLIDRALDDGRNHLRKKKRSYGDRDRPSSSSFCRNKQRTGISPAAG